MTMLWILLGLFVFVEICIGVWFVRKSLQTDAEYEKALDEIYGRKR